MSRHTSLRSVSRSLVTALTLLGAALISCAAQAQSSRLPAEARNRARHVAAEALEAGDITKAQQADLVYWTGAEPCKNVRMKTTKARETAIAQAISQERGFPNSRVLAYFEEKGWYVVFTNASSGDEPYYVYDRDPATLAKPLTSWSGAATMFETTELRDWLLATTPGIPRRLADCFAWQVTLGQ